MDKYLKFYNLENYLFCDVSKKFKKQGYIDAFDFFCIIIWKANRAKSKIAKKLKGKYQEKHLKDIVVRLTKEINNTKKSRDKLYLLLEDWNFSLPMASAILTVLYPNEFTVYDIRVCNVLNKFHKLRNKIKTENIIDGYFEYLKHIKNIYPKLSLRDKDRNLWAKSFYEDLKWDIEKEFKK